MTTKTNDKNPVARLREKFFDRKKSRTPSAELKETLRKKEAPTAEENEQKKVAKKHNPRDASI